MALYLTKHWCPQGDVLSPLFFTLYILSRSSFFSFTVIHKQPPFFLESLEFVYFVSHIAWTPLSPMLSEAQELVSEL